MEDFWIVVFAHLLDCRYMRQGQNESLLQIEHVTDMRVED